MDEIIEIKKEEIEDDVYTPEKPIKEEPDFPEYVNVHTLSHLNTNDKPKPVSQEVYQLFRCTKCNCKYIKMEYLMIHSAVHDPDLECIACKQLFSCKKKFKVHVNQHIKLKMSEEKKVLLTCTHCFKTFPNNKQLMIHTRVHTNERPYKCEICSEGFKQIGALKVHYITHTKEKAHTCEICNGAFTTASSLKRHKKRIHDTGKTMDCRKCNAKFQNKADFNSHMRDAHPFVGFKKSCPTCCETFDSESTYTGHRRKFREHFPRINLYDQVYKCKLCGEYAENMKIYTEHRQTHLLYTEAEVLEARRLKLFPCKLCTATFTVKQNLYNHMDKHLEKTMKCGLCDFFSTYLGLSVHKKRAHQLFDCRVCHQTLAGQLKLQRHYKKNHANSARDYLCYICGKAYGIKKILRLHFTIKHHNEVKNFKCSTCKKRFTTHYCMILHKKKLHNWKLKIKCSKCDTIFNTYKALVTHNLIHKRKTGTKPSKLQPRFRCMVCKKIFHSANNYKTHISLKSCMSFLAEQRGLHKCDICSNSFSRLNNLKRHLQLHSSFEFQCLFCDKTYKVRQSIQDHLKKYHPARKTYWCNMCGEGFESLSERVHSFKAHAMNVEKIDMGHGCAQSNIENVDSSIVQDKDEVKNEVHHL